MPYKIRGKDVLNFKEGRWKLKQRCSSTSNAKEAINLLRGIEHGMVPRKRGRRKSNA